VKVLDGLKTALDSHEREARERDESLKEELLRSEARGKGGA
jgi:hypothetical protein